MILVSGATGMLGGMITRRLLDLGHPVRMLVRPGSDYQKLVAAGADFALGDLKVPDSVVRACEGIDVVVTTANSARRGGEDNVDTIEREGNRNLIDAARAAGVRRFVFVSALGAHPDSPADFLSGKGAAEVHLESSGLEYVILQPNLFMEVWIAMMMGPAIAGGPVTFVRPAQARHTFVAMDDVADLGVAAAIQPSAANRRIVLGGPDALSWRDVTAIFERALGRAIDIHLVDPGDPLPGLPPVVAQLAAAFESHETAFDSSAVAAEFGLRLRRVEDFARAMTASAAPGIGH